MISICIPVYNCFVKALVDNLYQQVLNLDQFSEIIVIDDASTEEVRKSNKQAIAGKATYIQLEENIGRSRIRNLFLQYAKQPYLVFLDCDVVITSDEFIENYLKIAQEKQPQIVTGGHNYANKRPGKAYLLRWKFGVKRETPNAQVRTLNPYKSFKTSNFMVSREVFEILRFDENIKGYGHEDTLFGIEAKAKGITIFHIDNPVFIDEMDTNQQFIQKTENGIINLIELFKNSPFREELFNSVNLLRAYKKLKENRSLWVIVLVFRLFGGFLRTKLTKGQISQLRFFDLYKIGFLIVNMKKLI
jgi:glycosyltransferase involved in cell wall biosynthesis